MFKGITCAIQDTYYCQICIPVRHSLSGGSASSRQMAWLARPDFLYSTDLSPLAFGPFGHVALWLCGLVALEPCGLLAFWPCTFVASNHADFDCKYLASWGRSVVKKSLFCLSPIFLLVLGPKNYNQLKRVMYNPRVFVFASQSPLLLLSQIKLSKYWREWVCCIVARYAPWLLRDSIVTGFMTGSVTGPKLLSDRPSFFGPWPLSWR